MPISLCQWTPLQRAQLPAGYCCPLGSSPQPFLLRAEQSQPLSLSWCISCTKPTFTLAAQLWAPSTKTPPLLPRVTSPPGVPAASQLGQAEKHLLPNPLPVLACHSPGCCGHTAGLRSAWCPQTHFSTAASLLACCRGLAIHHQVPDFVIPFCETPVRIVNGLYAEPT